MSNIEYIARAVIEKDGQILLCQSKKTGNLFFPGGHIEDGESAPVALLREINEELGVFANVEIFIGAAENKFEREDGVYQEINLIFSVTLDNYDDLVSREDHIDFVWLTYEEMESAPILPISLRDAVIRGPSEGLIWESEGFAI